MVVRPRDRGRLARAEPVLIDLSHQRIADLTGELNKSLKRHYLSGNPGRDKVFEAVNALAIAAAHIIVGAPAGRAQIRLIEFMLDGLLRQLDVLNQAAEDEDEDEDEDE